MSLKNTKILKVLTIFLLILQEEGVEMVHRFDSMKEFSQSKLCAINSVNLNVI